MNQILSFSVPYTTLFFLPLFLKDLKYQTLPLLIGTCPGSLPFPLLVILSLKQCICWMVLRDMLLLQNPLFYILTVQRSQHIKDVSNVLVLNSLSPWQSIILKYLVSYFVFISPTDLMNDVAPSDVSNFIEKEIYFSCLSV